MVRRASEVSCTRTALFLTVWREKKIPDILVPQIMDCSSTGYDAEKKKTEVLDHKHAQRTNSTVKALSKHLEYNPFLCYL